MSKGPAVRLISVGKLKEAYFEAAFAEYQKRLGAFCAFESISVPEQRLGESPSEREIAAALAREASEIARHIPQGAAVCAFCVEGDLKSSEDLASLIHTWLAGGKRTLCFLIGGSCGLDASLKQKADLRLSMSRMTFPHHLFRVMAAEQLYRAFMIGAGRKYHK